MKVLYLLRKDLRIYDNYAIQLLIEGNFEGIILYVDDPRDPIQTSIAKNYRMHFLNMMNDALGGLIHFECGLTESVISQYIKEYKIESIVYQRQFEPWEVSIEKEMDLLEIKVIEFDDFLMVAPERGLKKDQTIYRVFRPYYEKWLQNLREYSLEYDIKSLNLLKVKETEWPKIDEKIHLYDVEDFFENRLIHYDEKRNFPSGLNTSNVSIWLNNGAISIRHILELAQFNDAYLRQLAWRDYYCQWAYYFPKVLNYNFRKIKIDWNTDMKYFQLWKSGMTGYDLVDAAMRQLNAEGWINGRLRMICASFLIKDLHMDWKLGESYFYEKLIDADKMLNVGNWQWVAGTGALRQPYFRVINPTIQLDKYDKKRSYVNQYLSEQQTPIIDHRIQKEIFIQKYKKD